MILKKIKNKNRTDPKLLSGSVYVRVYKCVLFTFSLKLFLNIIF